MSFMRGMKDNSMENFGRNVFHERDEGQSRENLGRNVFHKRDEGQK